MNIAPEARIVLRARGTLESADLALRFLILNSRIFLRMSLVIVVPGLVGSLALRYVLGIDWLTTWFTTFAVGALLEGPFTMLAGQVALRRDVRVMDALQAFAQRSFAFMLALIAAGALQIIAFGLVFVPWLLVAPLMAFLPEVVLLEGAGFGAFRRSARMISGHAFRALSLAILLVAVRVTSVILVDLTLRRTMGVLFDFHVALESVVADGGSPYALVGLWLSVPVCAVIRYIEYVDFRTLCEGWDVQRRFQVLAERLATDGPR